MRALTLLALAALTFTTGCHGVDSHEVDTEDIKAHLIVSSDGRGETEITAELKPIGDSLAFVDLVAGETLRVNAYGMDRALESRWFDYHAELPLDRGGVEFQVRLERIFGTHAPDSWVELPARFEFYRTPGVYSLSWDALPIEWDLIADDPMHIEIDGPCIVEYDRTLSPGRDNGALILRPGDLIPHSGWDGDVCELNVTAERVRTGRLDRHFAGGGIIAKQIRQTQVLVEW